MVPDGPAGSLPDGADRGPQQRSQRASPGGLAAGTPAAGRAAAGPGGVRDRGDGAAGDAAAAPAAREPTTLLVRTAVALTFSGLFIALTAVLALDEFVVTPMSERWAADEAGLIELAAQTWVELPPASRPFFELELAENHDLIISSEARDLAPLAAESEYLARLRGEIAARVGAPVALGAADDLVWVTVPMGSRSLQVGFEADRRSMQPLYVGVVITVVGAVIVFLTSLFIVGRITRPLVRIAEIARRFRGGSDVELLPEAGPRELRDLARSFNTMAREISQLMSNRTTLLAGISHDLRTPLARMRLALELLPEGFDRAEVARLERNIAQMEELIATALQFARGLWSEPRVPTDVPALLGSIVDVGSAGGQRHLAWRGPRPFSAPLQRHALARVVQNLVGNAERYGGGSTVEVSGRLDGEALVVTVADRGPGIPVADRERVFQPFYRLETSRSAHTGGFGLGLAIVRQLCEAHGWTASIQDRPGGGTEVVLRVPLRPPADAPAPPAR
jgi:two-component system osmolarity sensor histidine kinase EnvZ